MSRSGATRDTFNGYFKYVDVDNRPELVGTTDNEGMVITRSGWYDFLRRPGQGDGAACR